MFNRISIVLLVFFGYAVNSWGQDTRMATLRTMAAAVISADGVEHGAEDESKCGTHLVGFLHQRLPTLDATMKADVRQVLTRPQLQVSRVSPSGRFRIHYDTTGFNQPAMIAGSTRVPHSFQIYVDSVAAIFDHVWRTQIDMMGYEPPPSDKGKGGGLEYDVYIMNLGTATFGVTYWTDDDAISTGINQRFSTYMEIDNDYLMYRTSGLDGLRVTAAHEFHHAVQIGSYGIWTNVSNNDLYFYEMSSTWMEEMIYPSVNDYLFDIPRYFRQFIGTAGRSIPFFTYDPWFFPGYERALFVHFLSLRHGSKIVRDIWTAIKREPFKESLDRVLFSAGTRFGAEFADFGFWNYYTADRAQPNRYYPEGNLYPRLSPNMRTTYDNFSTVISSSAYPVSSQVYEFVTSGDTVTAILVNVDLPEANISPDAAQSFELTLTNAASYGAVQPLANGTKGVLAVPKIDQWRVMYLSARSRGDMKIEGVPYPNPVRIHLHPYLRLPVEAASDRPVELVVLSSSLDRVYGGMYQISDSFGRPEVILPTSHLHGAVSSGVHFVIVRAEEGEYRWKVAFIL